MRTEDEFYRVAHRMVKQPHTVTDRELTQLRRSSRSSSTLLYEVCYEQWRRGLLVTPKGCSMSDGPCIGMGYWREEKSRVSDYPKNQISSRLF